MTEIATLEAQAANIRDLLRVADGTGDISAVIRLSDELSEVVAALRTARAA